MRRLCFAMLLPLALGACQREPDFDQRYDAARAKVRDTAAEIDRQIAGVPTSGPETPEAGEAQP
jgi:hypothetical protein